MIAHKRYGMGSKKLIVIFCFFCVMTAFLSDLAHGEEKLGWRRGAVGELAIAQAVYDNWAAGGQNSLAWTLTLDLSLQELHPRYEWKNTLKLAFGQTKQEGAKVRVSTDAIDFDAIFTYKMGIYVNPFWAVGLDTRFATGFDYKSTPKKPKSDFFDPVYLSQSTGLGVQPKPWFVTRLGVSLKEQLADLYASIWTDNPKTLALEKRKIEGGIESVTEINAKISEDLLCSSKLELFTSFEKFDQVDIKWDSNVTAKVAKYVTVNLKVQMFYDEDVIGRLQWRETLSMGLSYTIL